MSKRSLTLLCSLLLLAIAAACQPKDRCGKGLYYDGRSCRPVEHDASQDSGDASTPDAGGDAGAWGCTGYCDLVNSCIGNNSLAKTALPSVIAGLHADKPAECVTACEKDTADAEGEEVLACLQQGQGDVTCGGDQTQALQTSIELMGKCCDGHRSQDLCQSICKALKSSPAVAGMLKFCD